MSAPSHQVVSSRKSRVARCVTAGGSLAILGLVLMTGLAHYWFWQLTGAVRAQMEVDAPTIAAAYQVANQAGRCWLAQQRWEGSGLEMEARPAVFQTWQKECRQLETLVSTLVEQSQDEEVRHDAAEWLGSARQYATSLTKAMSVDGMTAPARAAALQSGRRAIQDLQTAAENVARTVGQRAAVRKQAIERDIAGQIRLVNARGLGGILVCLVVMVWLTRKLRRPLERLTEACDRILAGHGVDPALAEDLGGEFAEVSTQLHHVAAALQQARHDCDELRRNSDAARSQHAARVEVVVELCVQVRQLLNGVVMYLQTLCERCGRTDRAAVLKEMSLHLVETVDDILDLAQLDSGARQLKRSRAVPAQLMNELVYLLKPQAEAKRLELEAGADGDPQVALQTDPVRLRRALSNLVAAMIGGSQGGTLRIRGGALDRAEGPAYRFELSGPAPAPKAAVSEAAGATGPALRLNISRMLVKTLGGTLQSSQDSSTQRFVLIVPREVRGGPTKVAPVAAAPAAAVESETSQRRTREKISCRILLAEDGPENQRFINRLLGLAGAQVTMAANGQEVLDQILNPKTGTLDPEAAGRFDVILMDMDMPRMNGDDATRRLRLEGYRAPIVALTALTERYDEQRCLAAGCDYFLAKPIDSDRLIEILRQVGNPSRNDRSAVAGKP